MEEDSMHTKLNPRRAGAAAIAVTAAALAVASVGGTASAGPPACPEKTLCVWQHADFDGQLVKITKKGVSNKLAEKMNNEASSVINNFNKRAFLYDKRNAEGDRFCFAGGDEVPNLGPFNDLASSSKVTKSDKLCPF
jgi:hypothetical protein